VRVRLRQPEDKKETGRQLASASGAPLCGVVGQTVILYRPDPDALPASKFLHADPARGPQTVLVGSSPTGACAIGLRGAKCSIVSCTEPNRLIAWLGLILFLVASTPHAHPVSESTGAPTDAALVGVDSTHAPVPGDRSPRTGLSDGAGCDLCRASDDRESDLCHALEGPPLHPARISAFADVAPGASSEADRLPAARAPPLRPRA
jgi:hypothetical protein